MGKNLVDFMRCSDRLTRWSVGVFLVIIVCESVTAQDSDAELKMALIPIQFGSNILVAEAESGKLLQQNANSPENMGKIYLALASNNEYVRVDDISNIIEYSQKALQYPLDVMDACRAYDSLAGGLRMKMMSSGHAFSPRLNEREETEMRKQILDVYLNALKLILSKSTTLQKQKVPGLTSFSVGYMVVVTNATQTHEEQEKIDALNRTNELAYQKMRQEWQAQLKAHDEIVAANDLVNEYEGFKRRVIDLYRGIPFVEEITEEGEKIMPGAPVLKELFEEVKKANAPPQLRKQTQSE